MSFCYEPPITTLTATKPAKRGVLVMWWKRIATVSLVAGMFVSVVASGVGATEHDPVFEGGYYVLVIPGVGDFEFEFEFEVYVAPIEGETVAPIEGETVTTRAYPDGYSVDDDDPDKEAWKDAVSLEVEMKLDRIESDVTWGTDGVATLTLRDGSITVTEPNADGDFTVIASGAWTAFGSGGDWMVANSTNFDSATQIFKVEATADGIEIKAVSGPGDGFLNDLEEEYEEEEAEEVESEDDDSEGAGHGKDNNKGKGKNN